VYPDEHLSAADAREDSLQRARMKQHGGREGKRTIKVLRSQLCEIARDSGRFAFQRGRSKSSTANVVGFGGPSTGSGEQEEKGKMMRHLCEIGDFVRRLRVQARFGELSRAPLKLLRVQLCGEVAECDWIARPADQWDADLPTIVGERNVSVQALKDAIAVRGILFRVLPDLYSAALRVYRQSTVGYPDLIITGLVTRDQRAPATVRSVTMRAKLFGFRFWLDEGVLENLQTEEYAVNS